MPNLKIEAPGKNTTAVLISGKRQRDAFLICSAPDRDWCCCSPPQTLSDIHTKSYPEWCLAGRNKWWKRIVTPSSTLWRTKTLTKKSIFFWRYSKTEEGNGYRLQMFKGSGWRRALKPWQIEEERGVLTRSTVLCCCVLSPVCLL